MKPFVQFYFLSDQSIRIETNSYEVSGEARNQGFFYSEEVSKTLAYAFLVEIFDACVHGEVRVCVGDVPKAWCEDETKSVIFKMHNVGTMFVVYSRDTYGSEELSSTLVADYMDIENSMIYLDFLEFWDLARLYGTFEVVE